LQESCKGAPVARSRSGSQRTQFIAGGASRKALLAEARAPALLRPMILTRHGAVVNAQAGRGRGVKGGGERLQEGDKSNFGGRPLPAVHGSAAQIKPIPVGRASPFERPRHSEAV